MRIIDFLKNNNDIVETLYKKDNYLIIDNCNESNKCVVFFSSNGLYYPNTRESLITTVLEKDKFEWKNIASNKLVESYYARMIFIRDIHKLWYVYGISKQVNTIDKMLSLLKDITNGYEVTLVGNSSGGYLATLVGAILNVEKIISFSGQLNLFPAIYYSSDDSLGEVSRNKENTKYFDLSQWLKKSNVPLFYFYANMNSDDVDQKKILESMQKDNTFIYAFNSSIHGVLMEGVIYPYILTASIEKLISIRNDSRVYTSISFARKIKIPIYDYMGYKIRKFTRRIIKKISSIVKK